MAEASQHLLHAAAARKCWPCGCLHDSVVSTERAIPNDERSNELASALLAARERFQDIRYDCLGCPVCYPALATNALLEAGVEIEEHCPATEIEPREGWPPLPGDYVVLRYRAPVAICTLTDLCLAQELAEQVGPAVALVGTLQTENLGIERVVRNVLANPSIRFLVLCGTDSRKRVGHLPGQSLLALAESGIDERSRIVGAKGKRPLLRNLPCEAVEHFRQTVEVIDRVGCVSTPDLLSTVSECAGRDPGPAEPYGGSHDLPFIRGHIPDNMTPDPAGYFVVFVDRLRHCLSLEHFRKDGLLDAVIEGASAAELYTPAIERGLVLRLDHAAYLGRELARAESALLEDRPYIQDRAPDRASDESACTEEREADPGRSCQSVGGERRAQQGGESG